MTQHGFACRIQNRLGHDWSEWSRDGDYHDESHCRNPGCNVSKSLEVSTGHVMFYRRKQDEVQRSGTQWGQASVTPLLQQLA